MMSDLKNKPLCIRCGSPMVNDIDPITGKKSKYIWKTTCEHMKNARLCIG
jgi:hypothetical protein